MKYKLLLKIFTAVLAFVLIVPSASVLARSSEEIQDDIDQKEEQLDDLNGDLAEAEKKLEQSKNQKNSSLSEIERTKLELVEVETELKINLLKRKKLQQQISLKGLEKENKEKEQDQQITEAYISWKTDDITQTLFGSEDLLKNAVYQEFLSERSDEKILGLSSELSDLKRTSKDFQKEIKGLETDFVALEEKKNLLESKIAQLDSVIASSQNDASGIRAQIGRVQQEIEQLTAEQQAITEADDDITDGNQSGGTKEVITGELYFSGTGRDLYQGHGVGMSQFGAYGAAANGWTAERIVTFYYTNTSVVAKPGTVRVVGNTAFDGYVDKVMNLNDYVAGLGEVPDKACGTQKQANQNPDKYVKDNTSTIWDCWPEEAIKAQVIAARSYAASNGGSICTTTTCQVYKGGNAKQWAANETKDKVIVSNGYTHNGQIIRALYSSDNSQGYGTADNDTIWSNFSGDGSSYSYLRHVNDSSFAVKYSYTNWGWRTNSYTIAEIDKMLTYAANNYNTGGSNSFIKNIKNNVGKVQNLSFVRDGSNRVKKVKIHGSKSTQVMAGWLFKAIWNSWVYNVKPSGEYDYIYSLTWFLKEGN